MKIDKNFKGLERLENGDYFLKGEIITDENLTIELDGDLKVEKGVFAKNIQTNRTLISGWGIEAGCGIEAKTFISSQKRIFAGISVYRNSSDCDKTIKCAELRSGEIAYGDLVITKPKKEKYADISSV